MRRALPAALAVAALAWAAAPAQADVVAAVGGVRDPAAGTLALVVQATDDSGAGVRSARAVLGGRAFPAAAFDCLAACPGTGTVTLPVATNLVADGPQRLQVVVEDGRGASFVVLDRSIAVTNTITPGSTSVTIVLGSGTARPQPSPPGDGDGDPPPSGPDEPQGCRSPDLAMRLDQRPLRFRRNRPVLVAGKPYRFRGRLTCRVDGRRRSAPRGTAVEVRELVRGRLARRSVTRVRTKGELRTRVAARSARTIVFRIRGAGGRYATVRIAVRVAGRDRLATRVRRPER